MINRNNLPKKILIIHNNRNNRRSKKIKTNLNNQIDHVNPDFKELEMQFKLLGKNEIHKLYILVIFLTSLMSITSKNKCIVILKKYRDRDVIIPNYMNDSEIEDFYNKFIIFVPGIRESIVNYHPSSENMVMSSYIQKGGYYFKRLEEKGDEPITGTDITRLLDEIQGITGSIRYTPEGRNLTTFDVLLGFFRGNEESLTSYLKFFVAPRFYSVFPPRLKYIFSRPKPGTGDYDQHQKFAGGAPLWERYEDIADYLLAYQSHQRAKKQYYVDQGLLPPDVLDPTFMEKLTNKLDIAATQYSQAKMVANKQIILGTF